MKKKTKFVQVILTREEWEMVKQSMRLMEFDLNETIGIRTTMKMSKSYYQNQYNIVYHFNHCALANIEDLIEKADKERRKKSRDKSKQKES